MAPLTHYAGNGGQWMAGSGCQALTEEEGLAREPTTGVNMSKEAQADKDHEVWEEIDGV